MAVHCVTDVVGRQRAVDRLLLVRQFTVSRSESDLKDVCDTERHLLYVACTRARDHLLVVSVAPASEFLDDLRLP